MHYPHPIEIAAKRKRIACILAAMILVMAGILYAIWPTGPYGPYYKDRPLTAWLEDYTNPIRHLRNLRKLGSASFMQGFKDSQEAVNAIGTNAIPTLLQLMQAKDSWPRALCLNVIDRPMSQQDYFISARHKRDLAAAGFMLLNTNALSAAPELIKLTASNDADVRRRAFGSLVMVETPNLKPLLPVLVQFSHDPDPMNREMAAQYIQYILPTVSPEDAKAAGVYEAFPELKSSAANEPRQL